MPPLRCPECGDPLPDDRPNRKTCGKDRCRQRRARRLKKAKQKAGEAQARDPEEARMAEAARGDIPEVAHKVVAEELRPHVREALTEDVLKALRDLVGLTPKVVAALEEDLASDDAYVRQKAYALIVRYTMGHGALVPKPEEADQGQMTVVFAQMPRPENTAPQQPHTGEPVVPDEPAPDATAVELRTCDACDTEKPAKEFVGMSSRCTKCHNELRDTVLSRFAGGADDAP